MMHKLTVRLDMEHREMLLLLTIRHRATQAEIMRRALESYYSRVGSFQWKHWNGGDCPVPEDLEVDVILRDGRAYSRRRAGLFEWRNTGGVSDVVAYWFDG